MDIFKYVPNDCTCHALSSTRMCGAHLLGITNVQATEESEVSHSEWHVIWVNGRYVSVTILINQYILVALFD